MRMKNSATFGRNLNENNILLAMSDHLASRDDISFMQVKTTLTAKHEKLKERITSRLIE